MSKVLQERGIGGLPGSTEPNSRDHVKSISTTKADSSEICRFIIIDDKDVTRDVAIDMPFFIKYVSCQKIMKKSAHRDRTLLSGNRRYGAYFEAKTKTFEDYSFLTNTPYPGKEIRRISAKSSQENAHSQFPIRRIPLLQYVDSSCLGLRMMSLQSKAFIRSGQSSKGPWEGIKEVFGQDLDIVLQGFMRKIEEDDDPDDITDIFKIEGNLFNFETPLTYEEYELNNPVTRDLEEPWLDNRVPYQLCDYICEPYRFKNGVTKWPTCSSNINGFCNGGELPGMVRVGSMTYFQDHKWYDELADRKLKEETLMHKAKVKESWGNTTPGGDPTLEPSVCKIRRFEMMKYSFNADKEYIAIKESEYLNHSKDSLEAYQELLHIIDEGWVMTTPDEE
ncbi:hypothetical protein Tco_1362617 [Tanacetum coccineum]